MARVDWKAILIQALAKTYQATILTRLPNGSLTDGRRIFDEWKPKREDSSTSKPDDLT